MPEYRPPFQITGRILSLVAEISEAVGRLTEQIGSEQALRLRRVNQVLTIQGSLAIEGNTLSHMLRMILDAIRSTSTLQVTPQVKKLLSVIKGEMTRAQLQGLLGLSDRKSFRERYLLPALRQGLIEITIPDKPNSRLQRYRLAGKDNP